MGDKRAAMLVLPVAVVLVAGCADTYGEFPADKTYTAIVADDAYAPVAGSAITMEFEDDRLSVNAGCNRLFGTVDMSLGTLKAPNLASTRMACPDRLMQQDDWLSKFLGSSPSWSRDDGVLTLDNGDSRLVLSED